MGYIAFPSVWECSGPQVWEIGDFIVSDFTDLRTSITTGYNHKITINISLKLAIDWRMVSRQVWHVKETAKSPVRSFPNKCHPTL